MKSIFRSFHDKVQNSIKEKPAIWYILLAVVTVLLWLPYYLSFYPGIVRYDEVLCYKQVFGEFTYSNHHPIIFTLFLKIVYVIVNGLGGSMNTAVAVTIFGQLLFFAVAVSVFLVFLWKRCNCIWINYGSVFILVLSPVMAKFAITLGKDTFFTGWFALYMVFVYCVCREDFMKKGWLSTVGYVVISVITALSRSNGLYIVFVMCVLLSVMCRKNGWRLWMGSLATIIIVLFIKGPVFDYYQVDEPSVAESFTVPMQQIGYVLAKDGQFEQADMEYLNRILSIEDWKNSYTHGISDNLKFHEKFDRPYLDKTAFEFLQVWARGLVPHFSYYVNAYLEQIRGYWDITQISDMGSWEIIENEYGIEQCDVWKEGLGFSICRICILGVQAMRKLPILNVLTNEALLILFWIGSWLFLLKKGKKGSGVILLPGVLLIGTLLLAAPVSTQFRYLLPNYFLIPYVLFLIVSHKKETSEKEAVL